MKLVVAFLVILVGGGALLYYGGGFSSFNPSEQGEKAKALVTPGMTWTKVIDAAGEPKEYQVLVLEKKKVGSEEVEFVKATASNPFDRKRFEERQKTGNLPHGFVFPFAYSSSVAFKVTFDGNGNVASVDDLTTMADLLQTKGR